MKSGVLDPATGNTFKWANSIALASVKVPNDNYYSVLGVDEDEEKVFQEICDEMTKHINVGAGVGGRSPILKNFQ